jgi:hypothetical protein
MQGQQVDENREAHRRGQEQPSGPVLSEPEIGQVAPGDLRERGHDEKQSGFHDKHGFVFSPPWPDRNLSLFSTKMRALRDTVPFRAPEIV